MRGSGAISGLCFNCALAVIQIDRIAFVSDTRETPEDRAKRLVGEQQRALDWINQKWKDKICPICGDMHWTIMSVMELRQYENGSIILGGNSVTLPVVPVICNNCGYTRFFNAMMIGALKQDEPHGDDSK